MIGGTCHNDVIIAPLGDEQIINDVIIAPFGNEHKINEVIMTSRPYHVTLISKPKQQL